VVVGAGVVKLLLVNVNCGNGRDDGIISMDPRRELVREFTTELECGDGGNDTLYPADANGAASNGGRGRMLVGVDIAIGCCEGDDGTNVEPLPIVVCTLK
jgi:hypothetical protein